MLDNLVIDTPTHNKYVAINKEIALLQDHYNKEIASSKDSCSRIESSKLMAKIHELHYERIWLGINSAEETQLVCDNLFAMMQEGKLEESITNLYSYGYCVQEFVDRINWRNNIDLLSAIAKRIPNHSEWHRVQEQTVTPGGAVSPHMKIPLSVYIDPDTICGESMEADIKLLMSEGLVDNDILTSIIGSHLITDDLECVNIETFRNVRAIASRNPTWRVDYHHPGNMLIHRFFENNKHKKMLECFVNEGFWPLDRIQQDIDTLDARYLPNVAEFLHAHPEWNLVINLNSAPNIEQLAIDLGSDVVKIDGQSLLDRTSAIDLKKSGALL